MVYTKGSTVLLDYLSVMSKKIKAEIREKSFNLFDNILYVIWVWTLLTLRHEHKLRITDIYDCFIKQVKTI
jgi:hypothetical protein